jgi:hypothetical protein
VGPCSGRDGEVQGVEHPDGVSLVSQVYGFFPDDPANLGAGTLTE